MAKHLDEIKGKQVPVWQQANPYYVENTPYPSRVQTKQKSSSTPKSNNYKPSRSTKRGDTVGAGEYAVSKGDSLWKIAQANGTTVEALKTANPEIKGNMIYPGQIIKISTSNNTSNKSTNTNNNTTTVKTETRNNTPTNNTSNSVNKVILNVAQEDLFRRKMNTDKQIAQYGNVRTNPITYQPTSPFTQSEDISYNEPIKLRKTLKPVVVKGKRSIKTTKGNNNFNIQQELRKRNAFYRIVDNM